MRKNLHKSEKIFHWLLFISLLGLITTSLAAEFFFSKEAIMSSFQKSLPLLNIDIAPADQFFISRIARRDTWDIHFYFGAIFGSIIFLWTIVSIYRRNYNSKYLKLAFFISGSTLFITGTIMFLRLYYPLEEDTFSLLKNIHYYSYLGFFATFFIHIVSVVRAENSKHNGVVSGMLNLSKKSTNNTIKSIAILLIMATLFNEQTYAKEVETDFAKWSSDQNYIDGVMYLEGEKGAQILKLELANCPYEKCINATTKKEVTGFKIIDIKKPDYKKAIELLKVSSLNGNPMASDKLLSFLLKRINYKSKNPDKYLLELLKKDTGLDYNAYKGVVYEMIENGTKTKKACYSSFVAGEFYEGGYLGFVKDEEKSKKHYSDASEICVDTSFYKMIATSKVK